MRRTTSEVPAELVDRIAGYLGRHPHAEDTLEGIAEWWLLEQQIVQQTSLVRQALELLKAQGWLCERTGRDGRVYYRLNPQRALELQAYLRARRLPAPKLT